MNSYEKKKNFKWKKPLLIECLGVKLGVKSNNLPILKKISHELPEIFPLKWRKLDNEEINFWISIIRSEEQTGEWTVYFDSEDADHELVGQNSDRDIIYDLIVSKLRAIVAEHTDEYVFLHAGAVGWKGRAIILPGKSRAGKTTLISELIKRGGEYFSDEFAVLDAKGFVHPFAKKLSVRGIIDEHRQVDVPIEKFGGKKASNPLPAGFILLTNYKKGVKRIKIRTASSGGGVMASLANSISVRKNPKFVLEVLSVIANQTSVIEGKRGEAAEFADFLLNYLENYNYDQKG